VDELAADLRVSRWQIYRFVRDGQLHAVRVGHRLRFRDEDVDAYLERPV
jgi:excisionase family DNA binding protein